MLQILAARARRSRAAPTNDRRAEFLAERLAERLAGRLVVAVAVAAIFGGCSVNPATGKRELSLVSAEQEIALGKESDPEIVAQFGLYPDPATQSYVHQLGTVLAAQSERPDLPWTFRVLDLPLVNAFALPGGFIYLTRGIMTHLSSEAELAGVLGHEIGHVTARHGASQMSKVMLGQLGLGVAVAAAGDDGRALSDLGQLGLGLLFLKYGRDDERQADSLGLRYALRTGHDPHHIPRVYELLGRVSANALTRPTPNWLLTHPEPGARAVRLRAEIAPLEPVAGEVGRERYLARLDGMVYGDDPREGFFRDGVFYHPDLSFALTFPRGWSTQNNKQAVLAASPEQDVVLVLGLAEEKTASAAAARFFGSQGIEEGSPWRDRINGLAAITRSFAAARSEGELRGMIGFIETPERVFELLGYTSAARFAQAEPVLLDWLGSFRPVTDRRILEVAPRRVRLVVLARSGPLASAAELRGQDAAELELLNNLDPGQVVSAGTTIKTIEGKLP